MANNLPRDAPLDLRYRYTIRPRPNRASMNISVNNNFVQALPISPRPL
ncbi:cellulose biosynthesis cyclic di-GMP-binding regulatory protein BcsB [Paraburkholderia sp.]